MRSISSASDSLGRIGANESSRMKSAIPTNRTALARRFANHRVPTDEIGFYNHPRFLAVEKKDSAFLEFYGAWVRLRPRDVAYDAHVRRVVPRIIEVLGAEIARDPQKGVCIDASQILTKMLELEGVWCYGVKGALTIESPILGEPTHFWLIDTQPIAGHMWVVAPPFEIVDVALGNQSFVHGEDKLVPQWLVREEPPRTVPRATDYCSTRFLELAFQQYGSLPDDIHLRMVPGLARPATYFPSFEVTLDRATLRYAAGGVMVSESPSLHAITSRRWNGKLPGELYDDVVRPALAAVQK